MKMILFVFTLISSIAAFAEVRSTCEGYILGQKATIKITINDVESDGLSADLKIPKLDYRFIGKTGPGTYDSTSHYGELYFYSNEERLVVQMSDSWKSAVLYLNGRMSSTFSCR